MEDVVRLVKGTVEELDRLLNAKTVLGDPIEKGNATIIPIVSYGFGFGAGGGANTRTRDGAGLKDQTKAPPAEFPSSSSGSGAPKGGSGLHPP